MLPGEEQCTDCANVLRLALLTFAKPLIAVGNPGRARGLRCSKRAAASLPAFAACLACGDKCDSRKEERLQVWTCSFSLLIGMDQNITSRRTANKPRSSLSACQPLFSWKLKLCLLDTQENQIRGKKRRKNPALTSEPLYSLLLEAVLLGQLWARVALRLRPGFQKLC